MIGTEIKAARLAAGMGQRELARLLELAPAYLCDIEQGQRIPPPATIARIAEALKTIPDRWLWLWAVGQMTEPLAVKAAEYREKAARAAARQQRRSGRAATDRTTEEDAG